MRADVRCGGRRGKVLAVSLVVLGGCAARQPFEISPPSPNRPWKAPDLPSYSAALAETERQRADDAHRVSIDAQKPYGLSELIDIAQRTNPETRVAWEQARQAAIAVGLAEGTYYPALAAAATGGVAHVPLPLPQPFVSIPGAITADARFVIPTLTVEWLLLDFGRRGALVDAARALAMEANVGFNTNPPQILFDVSRNF